MTGHTPEERRAIEASLPSRFRGRGEGYRRMLDAVKVRVSVSGIRGKSGLTMLLEKAFRERGYATYAKQTGTDPVSYKDGVAHPIDRRGKKVKLDETMWEMKRFSPYDVAIVENQAITEYTMRVFNRCLVRPHFLVFTNIRRDHQGDIARTLPGLARSFGASANRGSTVVSGEQRPELNDILRHHAEAQGASFVDVSVADEEYVPGIESVAIVDKVLELATGEGLSGAAFEERLTGLRRHFRWWPSSRPGIRWFHGGEINDIDSTAAIRRYLARDEPGPVTYVAYFRADRRDRTASFVGYLQEALGTGDADRAYVAGPGAGLVARRLSSCGGPVTLLPDDPHRVPEFVDRVARESEGGRVMTIVNAVPPFPKAFAREMSLDPSNPGPGPACPPRVTFAEIPDPDDVRVTYGMVVA